MASESCCERAKSEQLYMLELLVDRLNLIPEKLREVGSYPIVVKLEFLDFPTFEISEDEFRSAEKQSDKQRSTSKERKSGDGTLDFSAGKSCLFPKRPNELVDEMRSKPLKIGVYVGRKKIACSRDETDVALCKSQVPLPGCLCDQVCMSMNDKEHLPKPHTVRNTWNLIDDGGKPSGTILLFLRLTCLGKSIVTQFAVTNKSFIFKSSNSSNEFQCKRIPGDDERELNKADETRDKICSTPDESRESDVSYSPKPGSVIGLVSICQELAERDGGPLEVVPSLKLAPCRSVREQLFPKDDYTLGKSLVDVTCISPPDGVFFNKSIQDYSCGRANCSEVSSTVTGNARSLDLNHHNGVSTVRHFNMETRNADSVNYLYRPRMRGGGRLNDARFDNAAICEGKRNHQPNYRDNMADRFPVRSITDLISGSCKSPMGKGSSMKPGCGCFGKLGTGAMGPLRSKVSNNELGCSNEPCQGIDCLIRAFKETENFVESIGKVPGLAGLGLMDPAESPYFGREKGDALTSCELKTGPTTLTSKDPSSRHQSRKRFSGNMEERTGNSSVAAPGVVSPSHRDHNVYQTDRISLISKTKKKPEDKSDKQRELQDTPMNQTAETESSPCGQTTCKSRKKSKESSPEAVIEKESSLTKLDEATKKMSIVAKTSDLRKSKQRGKAKSSTVPGPGGDRGLSSRRISYVKVSKRIMRLVNTHGNTRFCYGHKDCLDVRLRVPGNMGWLWNTVEAPGRLKPVIGWKPGAISKFIWERLQQAKKSMLIDSTTSTGEIRAAGQSSKGRRHRAVRNRNLHRGQWLRSRLPAEDDDAIELPPTLHIHRKDGTYYVTMYPVKAEGIDEKTDLDNGAKPLQFKITKNRDNDDVTSSSTGSDMEIEFSPPAAITRYKKKEPVKHRNTQVQQQDILDAVKVNVVSQSSKVRKGKIKK